MPPGPILVINPGSTSTKLAVAVDGELQTNLTVWHSARDLAQFSSIWDQFPYRLELCALQARAHLEQCSAVVALGGLLRPVDGGIYRVNQKMLEDAKANLQGEHASNLGCALAHSIAKNYDCPAFVVDPVSVDEFEPLAYYSGHPAIKRRSLSHALNIHAAAGRASRELNISLENSSLIIAHLGGGISVAPVRGGKIIDVNDASSDGPFSPERTGSLPLQPFISLCFSGKYTEEEVRRLVKGKGGLVSYLGTNSVEEVEGRIRWGQVNTREVLQAMAYQIAKEIGAMATVLMGRLDAIVLTGSLARSAMLTSWIRERVDFLAPVIVHPGEHEMQALAGAALAVLKGEQQIKEY
ncbi:MAG TPA: butyrate kinase [Bacteroidota bacterium]|nr:butyrate kinase [Bacteroidota bacterium]